MLIVVEDREEMEEERRKVYSDCGVYVVKCSQRSVVIQTLRLRGNVCVVGRKDIQ